MHATPLLCKLVHQPLVHQPRSGRRPGIAGEGRARVAEAFQHLDHATATCSRAATTAASWRRRLGGSWESMQNRCKMARHIGKTPSDFSARKERLMILEIAQIDVKPGMEADFEAGVAKATAVFQRAKGCAG